MKDVWDHPSYPFRIFKSHYGPPELPVRKKGGKRIKYIAMVRNGIDVAASFTEFFSSHSEKFRSLWGGKCIISVDGGYLVLWIILTGHHHTYMSLPYLLLLRFLLHFVSESFIKGFPPNISDDSFDSDTPPAAVKIILPGEALDQMYFGYVKQWWPYRNDPNVMLMHYSNVRRDLRGHVDKIAKFLDVELSEDELDIITERCSIEHMKKVNKFNYLMPLNTDRGLWDAEKDTVINDGKLVNKGEIGRGRCLVSERFIS